MRKGVALLLLVATSPTLARAQKLSCGTPTECMLSGGLPRIPWQAAAALGALAAPIIVAGGVGSAIMYATRPKQLPPGVELVDDGEGGLKPQLALIPAPVDKYYDPNPHLPHRDRRGPPEWQRQMNDIGTTAAIALGGMALLGGIIAGIAKSGRR
jgi:hypothetical protein